MALSTFRTKLPNLASGMAATPQKTNSPVSWGATSAPAPAPARVPYQTDNPNYGMVEQGQDRVYDPSSNPSQIASYFTPANLSAAGFTGGPAYQQTWTGQGQDAVMRDTMTQPFADWLNSNNYNLSVGGLPGEGRTQAYIKDAAGKTIGESDVRQIDDSLFFKLGSAALLGAGGLAASGINAAGVGATGAGAGASGLGAAGDIGFLAANGMTDAAIAAANPALGYAGGLTGVGGTLGAANFADMGAGDSPNLADMGGGGSGTGEVAQTPFIPGADSAASGIPFEATVPSTVNLTNAGGTMATAGGLSGAIAQALADPANALKLAGSSALDFAKANPQLAALGVSSLAQLAGGSPSLPSASGGGSSSGSSGSADLNTLVAALEKQIGGMGAADFSSIPALKTSAGDLQTLNQAAIDAAYSQQTRYLDPQFQRDQQALEARLAEQGFVPGTPGYERAMSIFGETRNKAYGSARDSSVLQGYQIGQGDARNALSNAELNNSASRQALAQLLAERNQPFNELASLKGTQQIDYNNALDRYNAEVASSNSRNQALSQLALALGMYMGG